MNSPVPNYLRPHRTPLPIWRRRQRAALHRALRRAVGLDNPPPPPDEVKAGQACLPPGDRNEQ